MVSSCQRTRLALLVVWRDRRLSQSWIRLPILLFLAYPAHHQQRPSPAEEACQPDECKSVRQVCNYEDRKMSFLIEGQKNCKCKHVTQTGRIQAVAPTNLVTSNAKRLCLQLESTQEISMLINMASSPHYALPGNRRRPHRPPTRSARRDSRTMRQVPRHHRSTSKLIMSFRPQTTGCEVQSMRRYEMSGRVVSGLYKVGETE